MAQPPTGSVPKSSASVVALGVTDQLLIDQLMADMPGTGSNSRLSQAQQNLKPYLMPVRKLGTRGVEMTYMLASCLEYYVNLQRNYKDNLSPDYIALNVQQKDNIDEGLRFLAGNGTVSASIMPYDAAQIPPGVFSSPKYTINNYLHIIQPFATEREKIFELRKALMRGHPVIVQIQTPPDFTELPLTDLWEKTEAQATQQHTMLIVGYDENRQAFELMSCWGATWANNGYLWMRYNDAASMVRNGYVMVPKA